LPAARAAAPARADRGQRRAAIAGRARVALAADADWIIDRQVAFIEEVGLPDRPERLRELLPPRIERGDFRIWDDGGPVAYAGYNDAAPEFARIAPVYTLPECRGRGYATSLVAALSRELKERGKRKLFLTTDVANPTSNAIYARIGFRPENDDCGFDFIAPGRERDRAWVGSFRSISVVACRDS
jgi:predicted GNAT family acetyltransferase